MYFDYQGPEVRSGDLPKPINLVTGQEFTFTIKRGVGTDDCVSVNYDDFVNDVEVGDIILVDGIFHDFNHHHLNLIHLHDNCIIVFTFYFASINNFYYFFHDNCFVFTFFFKITFLI